MYCKRKSLKYQCLTEMDDVLLVHMLDALADLPHVVDDFCLRHRVTLGRDPFEQFAAGQADETNDRDQE